MVVGRAEGAFIVFIFGFEIGWLGILVRGRVRGVFRGEPEPGGRGGIKGWAE